MADTLNSSQSALYRAVDEVLHYVWDPIGISNYPQARDEYHLYLPTVFRLLEGNSEADEIATYLSTVVVDHMCLDRNIKHDLGVAKLLVEWRQRIAEQRY